MSNERWTVENGESAATVHVQLIQIRKLLITDQNVLVNLILPNLYSNSTITRLRSTDI